MWISTEVPRKHAWTFRASSFRWHCLVSEVSYRDSLTAFSSTPAKCEIQLRERHISESNWTELLKKCQMIGVSLEKRNSLASRIGWTSTIPSTGEGNVVYQFTRARNMWQKSTRRRAWKYFLFSLQTCFFLSRTHMGSTCAMFPQTRKAVTAWGHSTFDLYFRLHYQSANTIQKQMAPYQHVLLLKLSKLGQTGHALLSYEKLFA